LILKSKGALERWALATLSKLLIGSHAFNCPYLESLLVNLAEDSICVSLASAHDLLEVLIDCLVAQLDLGLYRGQTKVSVTSYDQTWETLLVEPDCVREYQFTALDFGRVGGQKMFHKPFELVRLQPACSLFVALAIR
jgi:hypothetical protein